MQTLPQKTWQAGELYQKAREFFAAGRYVDSIKYAAAAQRRSPQTKLPTVLVAQSYYRLGKFARSAKLFQQIPVTEVPKEAMIDYVLAMFSAGKYREVIKAYPAVPDAHPYKDVARFYTGVSLLQFKLYQKAQYFLRNSRKIPASLISQKRRLLSEIDLILDREKSLSIDQSQQFYGYQAQPFYLYSIPAAPPPQVPEPLLPGGTPGKGPASAAPAPPAKPSGPSTSYMAKVGFGYSQSTSSRDFHGFKEERKDDRTPTASVGLGLKYLGSPRPFGAQPSLDIGINPSYYHSEGSRSSSRLIASSEDPENVQNVVTKSESSSYAASNAIGISGLYPVSDPVDLGIGYTLKEDYPKANTKNSSGSGTTSGKIVAEFDHFKVDFGYDSIAISSKTDPKSKRTNSVIKSTITRNGENSSTSLNLSKADSGKPLVESEPGIKSTTSIQLSWLRNFDDFTIGIAMNKVDKVRLPETAKGVVLSELGGKLEGTYNLSFGVSAVGSAALSKLSSLVVKKDEKLDDTSAPSESLASGTVSRFVFTLKVAPASWVSLNASYDYTDRKLTIGDELLKKRMMIDNWSQQTLTTLGMSASYTF